MEPKRTKLIRYYRICRHAVLYLVTRNPEHRYEIDHYYYMRRFKETI